MLREDLSTGRLSPDRLRISPSQVGRVITAAPSGEKKHGHADQRHSGQVS